MAHAQVPVKNLKILVALIIFVTLISFGLWKHFENAKFDTDNRMLLQAAEEGYLKTVKSLLDQIALMDLPDKRRGETPFYLACKNNNLEVAKLLHERGCDWRMRTNKGRSPLWEASLHGHEEVVKFLIKLGADVNEQDEGGEGPLHAASQNGHRETVLILLGHGARVNMRNRQGATPFYRACFLNRLEVAELLYKKGCDITMPRGKQSPREAANYWGHKRIIAFLDSIGAP